MMIEALIEPKWCQEIDYSTYKTSGRKEGWGHHRATVGMVQVADWNANPLGRHPFNIITEEIYNAKSVN